MHPMLMYALGRDGLILTNCFGLFENALCRSMSPELGFD